MYGNGINNPFMMSNMSFSPMTYNPIGMSPLRGGAPTRGLASLLGLGRSSTNAGNLLSTARSFNFSSLLNNTSKALGVVRDAIPIVKEVGPMMGNARQILKLASIFKDETDTSNQKQELNKTINSNEFKPQNIEKNNNNEKNTTTINSNSINNQPNFFL